MAGRLPSKETLIECMDLATTPEAAAYLSKRFEAVLEKQNMLEQFQALTDKFDAYADEVRVGAEPATDAWRGEMPLSAYANASEQRVRAVEEQGPESSVEPVMLAIGIEFSEQGELNRGYMLDQEPADDEATQRLDVSFHAWLAGQGLLCRDQIIYQATEQGEIKTGADDQPLRVQLDELKRAVEAEGSGLKPYFEKHAQGTQVRLVQVKIPTAGPEAEVSVPEA